MTSTAQQRPAFDKQEQLQKIMEGLLQGETVIAVYDCTGAGTGFVGVTDKRLIIQDNSFVGKKTALLSLPYSRINAVSFVSDKSMFGSWSSSSEIGISAGGKTYEATFRGTEKARHVHNLVLWHMMQH
jgi:Bacterial PH domain